MRALCRVAEGQQGREGDAASAALRRARKHKPQVKRHKHACPLYCRRLRSIEKGYGEKEGEASGSSSSSLLPLFVSPHDFCRVWGAPTARGSALPHRLTYSCFFFWGGGGVVPLLGCGLEWMSPCVGVYERNSEAGSVIRMHAHTIENDRDSTGGKGAMMCRRGKG